MCPGGVGGGGGSDGSSVCSGHGLCSDGVDGTGLCSCDAGYVPPICQGIGVVCVCVTCSGVCSCIRSLNLCLFVLCPVSRS